MNIISKEEFISKKTSDTLVILGSGSSINNISDETWGKISKFNSIGFNWWCHHQFGPTFYVIREQANTKHRNKATETREVLFKELLKSSYASTCLVVHDLVKHSPKTYRYAKKHSHFTQDGIIVKDVKGKLKASRLKKDIFGHGVFHGRSSLTNVLHIAIYLKYKRIIFAGVDLRNSRYFWLGPKVTRLNIRQKGLKSHNTHPVAKHTITFLRKVRKVVPNVEMYTLNRKSMLTKVMEHKEII